jgi:hypothetical protein
VVGIGVSQAYPAQILRVDYRLERIHERARILVQTRVEQHGLLRFDYVGIDGQDTDARRRKF